MRSKVGLADIYCNNSDAEFDKIARDHCQVYSKEAHDDILRH